MMQTESTSSAQVSPVGVDVVAETPLTDPLGTPMRIEEDGEINQDAVADQANAAMPVEPNAGAQPRSYLDSVKYEETVRRFNARYAENDIWKLALDIDQLREKILNLFKLSPDADITLTYIDEDGEEVTLEDNEDLKDVVEQQLDPLRITVELNSAGSGRPSSKPSGSGSSHGRVKQEYGS
nr:protein NBR1 homolog isoform X1 [Ipomoea trifida]